MIRIIPVMFVAITIAIWIGVISIFEKDITYRYHYHKVLCVTDKMNEIMSRL